VSEEPSGFSPSFRTIIERSIVVREGEPIVGLCQPRSAAAGQEAFGTICCAGCLRTLCVCAHTNQLPVEFGEGFGRTGSRNVWKGEEIILAFIQSIESCSTAGTLISGGRLIVFFCSLSRGKINCRKSKGSAIFHYDCSAAESCSHFSLVNE
jgi:hypothetical protein